MNITELFPKRKKVVGWDEYGRRTAHSLKQDQAFHDRHGLKKVPGWTEMMDDIAHCETLHQLQKCRWFWSAKVDEYLWPQFWIEDALNEFDEAEKNLVEALAALQAE